MSRKIKCEALSRKGLLYILTVLFVSGTLFLFFPFVENRYGAEADLISRHVDEVGFDDRLPLFHENTISPKLKIEVEIETSPVLAVQGESSDSLALITVIDVVNTTITGYSSTVDQTNSEPFITASGYRVRDGIVAANFLPFGAKIRIPEAFGDKVFVVKDRMNRRFNNRVDVWFSTRQEALNFGVKYTYIEVIEIIENH